MAVGVATHGASHEQAGQHRASGQCSLRRGNDDELRFKLRQLNAEMAHDNAQLAEQRNVKLEDKQGFKTLMANLGVHKLRRANMPNWSSDVKQVASTLGGKVYDKEGRE